MYRSEDSWSWFVALWKEWITLITYFHCQKNFQRTLVGGSFYRGWVCRGKGNLIFQSFWASVAERECFVKMEFSWAFLSQKKKRQSKLRLLRHSYLKDGFSWVVSFLMPFIFFPIYITNYRQNNINWRLVKFFLEGEKKKSKKRKKRKKKLRSRIALRNSNFSGVFFKVRGSIHFLKKVAAMAPPITRSTQKLQL